MIHDFINRRLLIILFLILICIFSACNKDKSLTYCLKTNVEAKEDGGTMNNNSIKEIFSENKKFALVNDGEEKEVSISDIPGIFAPNDPYMKIWNFAIMDLDGDGIEELLLEIYGVSRDMGGYVVFRKENNKVSAYKSTNYRTFWFLKEDGTYTYSEGTGANDGYAKVVCFNENGYEEDKYTYLIDDHQGKIEYIVDHKSVTEEEFKNATVIQNSKKDIVWHEFSIENIGLFVNE